MDAPIQTRTPSIWWSSGYGVMTRWSRDQIPGSTEAFLMGVEIIEPRVLTFRRSLKKHRWSIFPKLSATASFVTISWFSDVNPNSYYYAVFDDPLLSQNRAHPVVNAQTGMN